MTRTNLKTLSFTEIETSAYGTIERKVRQVFTKVEGTGYTALLFQEFWNNQLVKSWQDGNNARIQECSARFGFSF